MRPKVLGLGGPLSSKQYESDKHARSKVHGLGSQGNDHLSYRARPRKWSSSLESNLGEELRLHRLSYI